MANVDATLTDPVPNPEVDFGNFVYSSEEEELSVDDDWIIPPQPRRLKSEGLLQRIGKGPLRNLTNFNFPLKRRSKKSSTSPPRRSTPRITRIKRKVAGATSDRIKQSKIKKRLKRVIKSCAKGWIENHWRESNRFKKLVNHFSQEHWEAIIKTDLQRTRRFQVCGSGLSSNTVAETFVFSAQQTTEQREDLVETSLKFLRATVDDILSLECPTLEPEGRQTLSSKAVHQGLTSLCQDFINEPYFKLLKESCEKYNLTPLTLKEDENAKWLNEIKINFVGKEMLCSVQRVFSTVWTTEIEVEKAPYIFGFKREYSIDLLGGPPKIMEPVWLGQVDGICLQKKNPPPKTKLERPKLERKTS